MSEFIPNIYYLLLARESRAKIYRAHAMHNIWWIGTATLKSAVGCICWVYIILLQPGIAYMRHARFVSNSNKSEQIDDVDSISNSSFNIFICLKMFYK